MSYRTLLPLVSGVVAIGLMAWSQHVDQQCIRYDAGRPFWPCETPNFILSSLNVPPSAMAQVLSRTWTAAPTYFKYALEFPLILWWWWFIGTRFDFGLLGVGAYKHRRTWVALTCSADAVLVGLLGWFLWKEITFHRRFPSAIGYGFLSVLGDLRSLSVYLWIFVLIGAFGVAGFKIFCRQSGKTDRRLISALAIRLAVAGFCGYCICVAAACLYFKRSEERKLARYDLQSVILKGKVIDEQGLPVSAVEVDLVPLLREGDTHPSQEIKEWTDKDGSFILRPEVTGRFFLSVLWDAPPSTKLPFLTRYYPDAPDQAHAETIEITPARHLTLAPIRLTRVQLIKVPVSVSWQDGKSEPDAYLFFTNKLFPQHGAIGSETLHVGDDGTAVLPAGFEYSATAQVDCDGGEVIKHPYTSALTLSTKQTNMPIRTLHFILPGKACRVWH